MTTYEAKRLCPDIIFVVGKQPEVRRDLYRAGGDLPPVHPGYRNLFHRRGFPRHHRLPPPLRWPETLARTLKASVKDELGLTCTIGMGPNILIAKLASDLAKPDGSPVDRGGGSAIGP